ncbi:MAG: TAT-variant-translocated molybdopterin oxidoreductase [Flavobacteriaceae bacterium]|nr:TAT-variant-translocated molybdopterin oxidoreductase [Flavobacteriaceae bacterium]
MASSKKYWKSVEELDSNNPIVAQLSQNEFVEEIPTADFLGDEKNLQNSSTNRRDFLKYVGFSTAAASLAACEGPIIKSVPYVIKPEEITPGVANYYASTYVDGFDFANVLVKTREGRPIKIENNTLPGTQIAANARVQAAVLSLYDSGRLKEPTKDGEAYPWEDFHLDAAIKFSEITEGDVVFLTPTLASPSTNQILADFKTAYPDLNVKHIIYDAVSETAATEAFQKVYGTRALADYDFAKADYIVSVDADFLGDWQGGGYAKSYAQGRVPKNGKMSRHIQFESNLSLTGASADHRFPLNPSDLNQVLVKIFGQVTGTAVSSGSTTADDKLATVISDLKKHGTKAVVVSGIQDVNAQLLVLAINQALQSEAFDTANPRLIRQGHHAAAIDQLIKDMASGTVKALILNDVNPVYSLPNGDAFAEAIKNVEYTVAFANRPDETTALVQYLAPLSHNLESWGDVEIKKGQFALIQPTINPLFDSTTFQQALMNWSGNETPYYDYLKKYWVENILNGASWNQALHDGVFVNVSAVELSAAVEENTVETTVADFSGAASALAKKSYNGDTLKLYTKTALGDGRQANNPWLQEMPDPITRAAWDNYLTVSKADADRLGFTNEHVANGGLNGSYAKVTVGDSTLEKVPVIIQPGQAKGVFGLALGYGRQAGLKSEMQVGVNTYKLYKNFETVQAVTVEKVSGTHEFACLQLQNTLMGRGSIIKETTLDVFNTEDKDVWNEKPHVSLNHQEVPATSVDLWTSFDRSIGHHFNLSIDLNACTGCGACVIACQAENNVPVVGKVEIRKSRDMHWLRIDRYYSSEETFAADTEKKENISGVSQSVSQFGELEIASENPQVAFQPIMCQHCNHAPCETVCPVAATSHGQQGQNQMAYNRCVGTRYCANNCPYKVRRFNWFLYNNNDEFDYNMNDDLGKMVLNPDVVVRSRGVMEKCSMCIQKTQKTILDAKRDGRVIKDGEFQTACSSACATGAIAFGDINDETSQIATLKESDRVYHLLEEVGTKPNVFYHVKVRNTVES